MKTKHFLAASLGLSTLACVSCTTIENPVVEVPATTTTTVATPVLTTTAVTPVITTGTTLPTVSSSTRKTTTTTYAR